jgi:hypothetical protein
LTSVSPRPTREAPPFGHCGRNRFSRDKDKRK